MLFSDLSAETLAAAVDIAARRKCGAVVRDGVYHAVRLCCDPTLIVTPHPIDSCECLRAVCSIEEESDRES